MGDVNPSHDDYLARRLAEPSPVGIGDLARFDHARKQWHIWDQVCWKPDKTDLISDLTRQRALAWIDESRDSDDRKAILPLLNYSKKVSVLKSLAAREGIAMVGNEWDPDPELLAFRNGVLNLRTGEFERHPSPELLISRTTGYDYNPDADPAPFANFVRGIMGDDEVMAEYVCRVLGYSLIGWQHAQKFWMFVGQGQNGKGVLTRTVTQALGDYASSPPDTLYMRTRQGAASSDKPRPELLRLSGVRFTSMSEPQGGQFNEEMLKAHSGNDAIEARDLYAGKAGIIRFYPTHTIIFLTNDPPRTEDVGPSMQRRVRIIRFEQDYRDPARDDKMLEDRLKEEANIEGLLLLLTRFAKLYFDGIERGDALPEPAKVTDWSAEYIEENDPLAAFIGEACVTGKGVRSAGALMWAAYQDWAAKADVDVGSQTGFGLSLGRRFVKEKTRTGTVYHGIRPKSAVELTDE